MDGLSLPHLPDWGSAPVPVFLSLFRVIICHLRVGKRKIKNIETPIWARSTNTYKCCILKVQNRYRQKKIRELIPACSTGTSKKRVCKILYESANKCDTHKHLGANTPINDTFSKSKIGLKTEKKLKKNRAAWSTYHLNKLVCKLWYQ